MKNLISNKADVVLLPEPKVTAAMKNENAPEDLRVALNLNELWEKACEKNNDDSCDDRWNGNDAGVGWMWREV